MEALVRVLASFTDYEKRRDFHAGRVRLDLSSMEALCRALGDPQHAVPAIHVGGSKGKGSTALMLSALLRAEGLTVGCFTSPHLEHLGERIAVGGAPLPEAAFLDAAGRVLETVAAAPGPRPTFFEFITATAMTAFRARGVDAAVYEVGLGGRLDATNVLRPEVAVITTVELEHCAVLGSTEAAVAREKAGIVKPGVPLVTAVAEGTPARAVIEAEAARRRAPLLAPGRGLALEPAEPGAGTEEGALFVKAEARRLGPFRPPRPRALQAWNGACAAAAAALFLRGRGREGPGREAFSALESLVLPGRFERFPGAPEVVLDGAHTPASAAAVAAEAARLAGGAPLVVVLGLAEDKDAAGVLEGVWAAAAEAVFTPYPGGRALAPERLRALSGGRGRTAPDPGTALRLARRLAGPEGLVLVTGSFYLAGALRPLLSGRDPGS